MHHGDFLRRAIHRVLRCSRRSLPSNRLRKICQHKRRIQKPPCLPIIKTELLITDRQTFERRRHHILHNFPRIIFHRNRICLHLPELFLITMQYQIYRIHTIGFHQAADNFRPVVADADNIRCTHSIAHLPRLHRRHPQTPHCLKHLNQLRPHDNRHFSHPLCFSHLHCKLHTSVLCKHCAPPSQKSAPSAPFELDCLHHHSNNAPSFHGRPPCDILHLQ